MRTVLCMAALLLAGCAQQASIADCGLVVHMPARPIDEGVRFDVRELAADPPSLAALEFRITNGTSVAYEGNLGTLGEGNRTLRLLDAGKDGLLHVGDAIVLREHGDFRLRLHKGAVILGGSDGCA